MGIGTRLATASLLGALALGTTGAPVAGAGAIACAVRNVTQDTMGTSFPAMVRASMPRDVLRVRGVCEAGIAIGHDLRIIGAGDAPTLTGLDRHRWVLRIAPQATVVLRRLTITRGRARQLPPPNDMEFSPGGGIRNLGTLTLSDSRVLRNVGSAGAGIRNGGTIAMIRSTVARNRVMGEDSYGAGIANDAEGVITVEDSRVLDNRGDGITNAGSMTLLQSVVAGHTGADWGGGISNRGTMTLVDSVVHHNHAELVHGTVGGGGGINNRGMMTLVGSAITDNSALSDEPWDIGGGGIYNDGILVLVDTVVKRNRANQGGGIGNGIDSRGSLTLRRSTVTENVATEQGGGISNAWGAVTLRDSAVTGNTAGALGGGIWNGAHVDDVLLAGSSSVTGNTPDDCYGTDAC